MVGFCNGWSKVDSSGKPDLGDVDANAVKEELNEGRKQWDAKKREWRNPSKVWESFQRNFVDHKSGVKQALRDKLGAKPASRIIRELEISAGGSAKGDVEYQEAYDQIFAKLSEREFTALNEIILARRVVAVSKNKKAVARSLLNDKTIGTVFNAKNKKHIKALVDKKIISKEQLDEIAQSAKDGKPFVTVHKMQKDSEGAVWKAHVTEEKAKVAAEAEMEAVIKSANVLHPGGKTGEQYAKFLKAYEKTDPKTYKKLDGFADKYFKVMENQLRMLKDGGLITEKAFKNMKAVGDYSPRRYIQFFDPDISSSSLEAITTGSTQALEQDSALLMKDYIVRLHSRIATNEANVSLLDYAKENKGNGIAELMTDEETAADNFKVVSAWVDGKKIRMKMPLEYGKDWGESDPALDSATAKGLRFLSGSSMVRALATGYNPEFAITNFPRDIFFSWFRTHEYNTDVVTSPLQIMRNLGSTASDVWNLNKTPVGAGKAFLQEGGMMEFMTAQGQWYEKKSKGAFSVTKLGKGIGKVAGALSYFGQKTELWTRLALREQAIRNRVDSATFKKYQAWLKTDMKSPSPISTEVAREATWIARGYLDFSQGGKVTKAADTMFPYLNAAVQGTRGMFSTFAGVGATNKADRAKRSALAVWKMSQFIALYSAVFMNNLLNHGDDLEKVDDRDLYSSLIFFSPFTDETKGGQESRGFFKIALDQSQQFVASTFGLLFSTYLKSRDDIPPDSYLYKFGQMRPEIFREGMMSLNPVTSYVPPTVKALFALNNFDTYRMSAIWKKREVNDKNEEYTAFTHPALRMSVKQLNEMFPDFNGAIPANPFSPERMRFVLDTFFVPSSSIMRLTGLGIDSAMDAFTGTEYEDKVKDSLIKEKRHLFKRIPGLDRVFEMTHGESQDQRLRAEKDKLDGNTRIAKVENQFNLLLSDMNNTDIKQLDTIMGELRKTIDNAKLPKADKTRLRQRAIDAMAFKRSVGDIPDPRFWWQVSTAKSGEVRARLIFSAMKRKPKHADTLKKTYHKLKRVKNDRTTIALLEMMKKDRQGIPQSWEE